MLRISKSAKEAFEKGQFTIKHKQGSFNGTYADMATEHHLKEVKGPGGFKHAVRKESALVRWNLTVT